VIRNLATVAFTSPTADEWRTFGPDVLGAELADDGPDGAVRLRIDDAPWRIEVRPGAADDVAEITWEVDDLAATIAAVEAAGRPVHDGAFVDPFGFAHRLVAGIDRGEPFTPARPMGGFVTGDQGLGHVVLIVPDLEVATAFYGDVLGFAHSDDIDLGLTVRFFHCVGHAARHHSLAVTAVPGMVGVHHLMLEVASLDDVGTALDVVEDRAIPLAMGLGRHTNDLMTSFYVRTPSGFEIEYGTGGLTVDHDRWTVGDHDAMSLWGHRPPAAGPLLPGILRPHEPAGTQP
jgi:2,3-dihydroxybiphenyl 1,2-dioxygenase